MPNKTVTNLLTNEGRGAPAKAAKHFGLALVPALLFGWSMLCGCALRRMGDVATLVTARDTRGAAILERYEQARASQQASLRGYQAEMEIAVFRAGPSHQAAHATAQKVVNPSGLVAFQNMQFAGDRFLKVNVISRILQEERNGSGERNGRALAITRQNYIFKYLGEARFGDHRRHLFRVKPRTKAPGLFRGHLWIDADGFQPIRVEGQLANKPSWFLRRLSFIKTYEGVCGYGLPGEITAVADIRLVGRILSRVTYRYRELQLADYKLKDHFSCVVESHAGSPTTCENGDYGAPGEKSWPGRLPCFPWRSPGNAR